MGISRLLIIAGLLLVLLGVFLRLGLPIGRLPGDIVIRRGSSTFYFPIVTSLIISVILSLIGLLFRR